MLDLIATPLAVAVHGVRLSDQLQTSRERLVGAAEEERWRLHRELHDSLLDRAVLLLDVLAENGQRCPADGSGGVRT